MEQRLIDATKLQGEMMDMVASGLYGLEDMIDAVIEQPTVDAVQVVRCKECKRWTTPIPIEMKKDGYGYCGGLWTNTHMDDFCAWGERRNK
jgi:hypothetical protein